MTRSYTKLPVWCYRTCVKAFIVAALLLGCAHAAPQWPKSSAKETDGGESLAPHESKWAAATDSESKSGAKSEVAPTMATTSATDSKPALSPTGTSEPASAPAAAPEPEGEETIVIEIDDD